MKGYGAGTPCSPEAVGERIAAPKRCTDLCAAAAAKVEDGVVLCVSKGNLRHRIAKLGTEVPDAELSVVQRQLRDVALKAREAGNFDCETPPERPGWANGAFLYLEPEHAAAIEGIVKWYGLKLQSKHVLTSQACRPLVARALQEGPEGPGREAFLMRRAGFVERAVLMPLPTLRRLVLIHTRGDVIKVRSSLAKPGAGAQDCEYARSWDVLREIAKTSALSSDDLSEPECPLWARGAHVYLDQEHVADGLVEHVKTLLEDGRLELGPGRILTSSHYRTLVERALGLNPQAEGLSAEAFLTRREEVIAHEEALPEPASLPGDAAGSEEKGGCGTPCQNILLVKLHDSVMHDQEIDFDLAEFLASPPSTQKQCPEMWQTVWQHVCEENDWIEMRDAGSAGWCPYDKLCSKWAEVSHLLSPNCRAKVKGSGKEVGHLLAAILEAVRPPDLSQSSRPEVA